ncbi:MAG TPA: hypothetical protein VFP14_03200 [Novosphingobium sp.]|nr:hypothetical protein [Novosphingobium sp.]
MNKLWGGILLAAGILIAGTSGLCSAEVLLSAITGMGNGSAADPMDALVGILFMMVPVALFGGVPFLVGVLMIRQGLKMTREPDD